MPLPFQLSMSNKPHSEEADMNSFPQPALPNDQQQAMVSMLPADYNTMCQDVSNYSSRFAFLRRTSQHSSNTANSGKRGMARIMKPTSASNSPHDIQRRRTTANTTRAHSRISHESPYYTREQRIRDYHFTREQTSFQRPMSWHPGSEDFQSSGIHTNTSEPAIGNTIAELENLAVSGAAASAQQQSIHDAFTMGYGYPINSPNTAFGPSPAGVPGYGTIGPAPEPSYDSYPTYSISDPFRYPHLPQAATYSTYPAANYQPSQHWAQHGQHYTANSQASQATPAYVPALDPFKSVRQPKATQRLVKKKSKELVGMGLYDDKASDYMSSLNSASGECPSRDSVGKGLKLEETWQPPDEDEDQDDDEGYSTDEAEDAEEPQPSFMTPAPAGAQIDPYPTYGDLSNQSFLFNDDDGYVNDDPYANMLAYEQGLSEVQSKQQPNLGMESYLWL